MSVVKATANKKATTRLCETCNSTKHHTALCDKARQTRMFVASLVAGDLHSLCCVVNSLDRVQLKELLAAILSHKTETGNLLICRPNKPVSKMTNAQLARECIYGHRKIQENNRKIAQENIEACPICMEDLMPFHVQCKLACGHSLHTKCYSNMLVHNCRTHKENNCPLCRNAAF